MLDLAGQLILLTRDSKPWVKNFIKNFDMFQMSAVHLQHFLCSSLHKIPHKLRLSSACNWNNIFYWRMGSWGKIRLDMTKWQSRRDGPNALIQLLSFFSKCLHLSFWKPNYKTNIFAILNGVSHRWISLLWEKHVCLMIYDLMIFSNLSVVHPAFKTLYLQHMERWLCANHTCFWILHWKSYDRIYFKQALPSNTITM